MKLYDGEQWLKENFIEKIYYWRNKTALVVKVKDKDVMLVFKFMGVVLHQIVRILRNNGYDVEDISTEELKSLIEGGEGDV